MNDIPQQTPCAPNAPSVQNTPSAKKIAPTKEQMLLLPPFDGLTRAQIFVPATEAEFLEAASEINAAGVVGFDTESKPI